MTLRRFLLSHKISFVVSSLLLLGGIVLFLHHTQATSSTVATRDAKRISDLQQVQNQLEMYFNKCGYYPGGVYPGPICALWIYNSTWETMRAALVDSKLGVSSIPNDPSPGMSYFYGSEVGGKGYALGAALEDPTNPALAQGAHGLINSVECFGSMYCVHVSK
jgi:hypothetical protein